MNSITIFISSVQDEFAAERRKIAEYIRQDALFSQYFVPFLSEEIPAQDKSAQVAYLEQAADAEVFLLLLGSKYGSVGEDGISPTEKEYDTAVANHAYRMVFVKKVADREPQEDAFKKKIDNDVIRNVFESYDELQNAVYSSLIEYMVSHHILRSGPFDASIHQEAKLDDLDKSKIRWFVGVAREKRQFPFRYSDDNIHPILNSLHLVTDDNKLKNAALLLFAKDVQKWFPSATIKCAHFYGEKIQKPIASQQIYGGNVFEMVDMAVSFVMSRINQHVGERNHSAQVEITPELPAQAVTEAIVNAVVHRDYNSTGSVQVMLFKNRLEVWNPGRLPLGMTIEKLNREHTSRPVNPVLANPVYLAGYIEQMGTGTTDIIDSCLGMGLRKPEFFQGDDFRIILWRSETGEVGGEVGGEVKSDITGSLIDNLNSKGGEVGGEVTGEVGGEVGGEVEKRFKRIVLAIKRRRMSAKEIMAIMKLKGEDNFRKRYLTPAIDQGYVSRLYPDAANRPDQAYYLTIKGLHILEDIE